VPGTFRGLLCYSSVVLDAGRAALVPLMAGRPHQRGWFFFCYFPECLCWSSVLGCGLPSFIFGSLGTALFVSVSVQCTSVGTPATFGQIVFATVVAYVMFLSSTSSRLPIPALAANEPRKKTSRPSTSCWKQSATRHPSPPHPLPTHPPKAQDKALLPFDTEKPFADVQLRTKR